VALPPLDTLETAVNMARVRLNDAIQAIGGDIFTDTAVFTFSVIQASWRRIQSALSDLGWQGENRETHLLAVPACTAADQGTRVYFNWAQYFDGTNPQAAPVLPNDCLAPLDLAERPTGSTGFYTPMDQCFNGLPTAPRTYLNRCWEWRGQLVGSNAIFMPGALIPTDILFRYQGGFPDFVPAATTAFAAQNIPIVNCLSAFAQYLCSEVARPRGDLDAKTFDDAARDETILIWNRDPRQGRSIFNRADYNKMVGPDTPTLGPAGPRGPQTPAPPPG
jgi:hypothetical protein